MQTEWTLLRKESSWRSEASFYDGHSQEYLFAFGVQSIEWEETKEIHSESGSSVGRISSIESERRRTTDPDIATVTGSKWRHTLLFLHTGTSCSSTKQCFHSLQPRTGATRFSTILGQSISISERWIHQAFFHNQEWLSPEVRRIRGKDSAIGLSSSGILSQCETCWQRLPGGDQRSNCWKAWRWTIEDHAILEEENSRSCRSEWIRSHQATAASNQSEQRTETIGSAARSTDESMGEW